MSANTERMNNDIKTIFSSKNDTQTWNISLTDPNVIFNESFADIALDPSLRNLTTRELNNENDKFKVVRLERISDMLGIELFISLSTASLSVTFCLVVCVFFVLLCLQERFDGDFLGGKWQNQNKFCCSILFSRFVLCLLCDLSVGVVPNVGNSQGCLATTVVRRLGCLLPLVLSQDGRLSSNSSHSSIHLNTSIQSAYLRKSNTNETIKCSNL